MSFPADVLSRMKLGRVFSFFVFMIVGGFLSNTVVAQEITPDSVIVSEPPKILANSPFGVPLGGFILNAGVKTQETYDDNIFRTLNDRTPDYLTEIKPALALQSNWGRHAVYFGGTANYGNYARGKREDFMDSSVVAAGRYDLAPETALTASLTHEKWHAGLGTGEDMTGQIQRKYTTTTERVGFSRELSYVHLNVTAENKDTAMIAGKTTAAATDMMHLNDKKLQAVLSYEFIPQNNFYLSAKLERANYTLPSSVRRIVDGRGIEAGIKYEAFKVLNGSFFGGVLCEEFTNPGGDAEDPYWGATASWRMTPITTLSATYNKAFQTSTETGTLGVTNTIHTVKLNHAFLERLIFEARGGVDDYDYLGRAASLSQSNRQYYGGASLTYKINDHVASRLAYDHRRRTSKTATEEFKDNRAGLSLAYTY